MTDALRAVLITASFAGGVFLILRAIQSWRSIPMARLLVRFVFGAFILFSTVTRTLVYQPGRQPAPPWYTPTVDLFFIALSILLMLSAWKDKR